MPIGEPSPGGSGGVGHAAVQIAAHSGADVIRAAGSEEARARLRELGATVAFDYESGSLAEDILAIDLNPQGHATEGLTLTDLYDNPDRLSLSEGLLDINRIDDLHQLVGFPPAV